MGGEKYDQIAPQAITQIEKNLKQLDELHGIQTLKQINTDLKGSKLKSVQHKLEKIQRQKTLYNTNHEYINRTNQSQNSEINQMNKGRFVHKCYYQSKNFVAKHDGAEHFYSLNHQDLTQRNPIANYEDTMHHPDCFKTRFKTKKQTLLPPVPLGPPTWPAKLARPLGPSHLARPTWPVQLGPSNLARPTLPL